jgi:multiple sugar transport system ATP-binding protein
MAEITLENVTKRFDSSTTAVADVSLQIPDKEFVVLLGPSGSGKSTLLRMIAGLAEVTEGRISIGGRRVDGLEPKDRNIAMVFQSYALYPHMSVRRNMSFPLIMRSWKWYYHIPLLSTYMRWRLENRADIKQRVDQVATILGLTEMLHRKPRTLSGGQRQRVAVGRAMVREPSVFLMDEPLSNLDAKLRGQMRAEIIRLHQSLQTTVVYVTHDQVEAMTMGTRIVVLKDGKVQQYDTPKKIFEQPANLFVAGFIGNPPMNVLRCRILDDGHVEAAGLRLAMPPALADVVHVNNLIGREALLGIRPERITLATGDGPNTLAATISVMENLGLETLTEFMLGTEGSRSIVQEESERLAARLAGDLDCRPGDSIQLSLGLEGACLFDIKTEKRYDGGGC